MKFLISAQIGRLEELKSTKKLSMLWSWRNIACCSTLSLDGPVESTINTCLPSSWPELWRHCPKCTALLVPYFVPFLPCAVMFKWYCWPCLKLNWTSAWSAVLSPLHWKTVFLSLFQQNKRFQWLFAWSHAEQEIEFIYHQSNQWGKHLVLQCANLQRKVHDVDETKLLAEKLAWKNGNKMITKLIKRLWHGTHGTNKKKWKE